MNTQTQMETHKHKEENKENGNKWKIFTIDEEKGTRYE